MPGAFTIGALAFVNLLIAASILVFARGFFPFKPYLPGLAIYENSASHGPPPEAPFDRLVFMVVDALRSDFVYLDGSGFVFTQKLIQDGAALPFTANARSPTITMPRIKALTTGSIPSFVDVILNFDEADTTSTLATQDTWLAQMKAKETGKLVLYGDDTWLKLFPSVFDRSDGTSSFFVADFTEVDNNVTRHISGEMKRDDWSTLVLHYLGLDHIGHKAGPKSPNMIPKQREMDGIVEEIFVALETEPHLSSTLLVLCGDHGMNDAGNHGASSPGETSPALVFISPKLRGIGKDAPGLPSFDEDFRYYSFVEQSDVAPTLAALLGFPIPKNNLGALIPEFLPFWPSLRDRAWLLMSNVRQMMVILRAGFPASFDSDIKNRDCSRAQSSIEELACRYHDIEEGAKEGGDGWLQAVSQWLRGAQDILSNMASNFDMRSLVCGILLSGAALLGSATLLWRTPHQLLPFTLLVGSYSAMMFGSSFIEEEHHFWYWAASLWLSYVAVRNLASRPSPEYRFLTLYALAMLATRLVRAWNQTGQKFAGQPDIVKIFLNPQPSLLWLAALATYAWMLVSLLGHFGWLPPSIRLPLVLGAIGAAIRFKLAFAQEDVPELVPEILRQLNGIVPGGSLIFLARAAFLGPLAFAGLHVCYIFTRGSSSATAQNHKVFLQIYALFAATQARLTNIPLLLLSQLQLEFLKSANLTPEETFVSTTLLQYMSFFAFGGSNSIASVDLSNAYNGVSGFNVVAVGVLTFVSNWVGPIFWTLGANVLLAQQGNREAFLSHVTLSTTFSAGAVTAVMAACTALRTHLFIWTVFSPKYLYCMAWNLGKHIVVDIGVAGILWRIAGVSDGPGR